MKKFIRLLSAMFIWAVLGFLLSAGLRCALMWYHGGSPDPRCVYGMDGYVEVRVMGGSAAQDSVSCEYRPKVWLMP